MKIVLRVIAICLASSMAGNALAAEPVNKRHSTHVAIGGYDSVAYHNLQRAPQGTPISGEDVFSVTHKGAVWLFATKQSAERFRATPDRFTPAYNGFCANALALGEGLIPASGRVWEIFGDELHLFFAPRGRHRWLDGNWERNKADADAAWAELKTVN